jgi:hypothetical protein
VTKIIDFIASSPEVELNVPPPKPAKLYIPEFYKQIEPKNIKNMGFEEIVNQNFNLKSCPPFIDVLTTGYIQEAWADIYFEYQDGQIKYYCPSEIPVLSHRKVTAMDIKYLDGFYPYEFVWKRHWIPKLPDGYSILVTTPLSRPDIPFLTMSGIIDADEFFHAKVGNIPFYLRDSFSGVIPIGTPMFQIIPFKRESWEINLIKYSDSVEKRNNLVKNTIYGPYKRFFHKKKNFS